MQGRFITNPVITEYLDSLYVPLDGRLEEFRRRAEAEGLPIILRDTERILSVLLRLRRPRRILEFGTSAGYSACCFAAVCGRTAEIVTLERDPEIAARARENIRSLGYEGQIRIVEGDAAETAAAVEGPFDFVFLDAGKSHYRKYWDAVVDRCEDGCLIVCDNVLMRGSVASEEYDSAPRRHRTSIRRMRDFLRYITETEMADSAVLAAGDGLSISVLRREGDAAWGEEESRTGA